MGGGGGLKLLYAGFETCIGWDPRHQMVLEFDFLSSGPNAQNSMKSQTVSENLHLFIRLLPIHCVYTVWKPVWWEQPS